MRPKFFFCIAAVLLFASCEGFYEMNMNMKNENSFEVFTATTESEPLTRTSLSGYTDEYGCYMLYWSKGDSISISDGESIAVYTTDDYYSSTAEFSKIEGSINKSASQYTAFYPATITESNMVLQPVQNYVKDNIDIFPMRAVSENKNLAFKNLCGIICFCLKSEDFQVSVSSISLSADKGMSGPFTVGNDNAAVVVGDDGVILKCTNAEPLNNYSTKKFNIVVPQGKYNPLKVKICDVDGNEINLVSESTISVKRSEITRITLTLAKSNFDSSLETIPITDSDVDFTER